MLTGLRLPIYPESGSPMIDPVARSIARHICQTTRKVAGCLPLIRRGHN